MSTNTFSSTAKLGEYFAKLPACKADGTNWVFFRDRFLFALDAAGLGDHFEDGPTGTTTEPVAPTVVDAAVPTPTEVTATNNYLARRRFWKSEQAVIKQGLASVIPDSLFLKVKGEKTAKEMWGKVKDEYEKKSKMVTVDLRRKLQDERCADGGDVKAHLDKLRTIRADLIAMAADPGDDNFVAIVLGSLPTSYETYLSALTGAATLLGKTLDPDTVLQGISDEADRKAARHGSKGEKEAAFYGNGGKKLKKMMECYNCHKKGHMSRDCWAKGGGKEGQNPHRKAGKANTAKAVDDLDAAWMAASYRPENYIEFDELDEESDDEYKDLPPLLDVLDSDDEADDTEEDEKIDEHSVKTSLTPENVFTAAATPEDGLEIYDSGASVHMTPSRHRLTNYRAIQPRGITAANNQTLDAVGMGDMHVEVPNGSNRSTRVLVKDVLYVPKLGPTLISIGRIAQAGHAVQFHQKECRIFDSKNHRIGTIPLVRGLYCVQVSNPTATSRANLASYAPLVTTPEELHRLMGHLPIDAAKNLVKHQLVDGIELDETGPASKVDCKSCLHGRMTRKPISKATERAATGNVGDEVHTDVWGPATIETPQHKKYYVSYTDEASRYTVLVLMRSKDETLESFEDVDARWETEHGIRIKIIHSDNGGEYKSHEFDKYLAKRGIRRRLTVHHTPEHNGVAERLNRTLLEKVRAMLHAADLPKNLWGEALKHAVWLKNRTSTRALGGRTPYEVFHNSKPDLRDIHEWGCKVSVHVDDNGKLDGRARDGRWLGLDQESIEGHRIYFPETRAIRSSAA
jgi:transposase InsO family protein